MEMLQRKHRQQQRDLQARITQKKKSATKKTRKGINDECTTLEQSLDEQHQRELLELTIGKQVDENTYHKVNDETVEAKHEALDEAIGVNIPMITSTLSPSSTSILQDKKPNRQKARLARRAAEQEAAATQAAEEAENLPSLREQERKVMLPEIESRGLKEEAIRSDGHCLYAAVADQLIESGMKLELSTDTDSVEAGGQTITASYKITRLVAASYISRHSNDFLPFLEEPLDEYTRKVRDTGEWGGQLELSALARAYGVDINVLQGDGKVLKIESGLESRETQLWLAYYRHNFGLGEHYNSLRRLQ
ncbi:hypothetical protein MMC12_002599 [Toensbergia leucococca]|nr:hypothetical protein [Toensbergia leucococca]